MALKIGAAGTHSTGKTTFLTKLRLRFQDCGLQTGIVSDVALAAHNAGFPILRDHTVASTSWIIAKGVQLELEAALANDVVLVDRPVADALGYLLAALAYRGETIADSKLEHLKSFVRAYSKTYAVLIKTVVDKAKPINQSKARDKDEQFRLLVAQQIDLVFAELRLASISLNSGCEDQVLDIVVRQARRKLHR